MKELIVRVGRILVTRMVGVITIAALMLLAGGLAMKTDVATAMIVIGALVLGDMMIDDLLGRRQGSS